VRIDAFPLALHPKLHSCSRFIHSDLSEILSRFRLGLLDLLAVLVASRQPKAPSSSISASRYTTRSLSFSLFPLASFSNSRLAGSNGVLLAKPLRLLALLPAGLYDIKEETHSTLSRDLDHYARFLSAGPKRRSCVTNRVIIAPSLRYVVFQKCLVDSTNGRLARLFFYPNCQSL